MVSTTFLSSIFGAICYWIFFQEVEFLLASTAVLFYVCFSSSSVRDNLIEGRRINQSLFSWSCECPSFTYSSWFWPHLKRINFLILDFQVCNSSGCFNKRRFLCFCFSRWATSNLVAVYLTENNNSISLGSAALIPSPFEEAQPLLFELSSLY